MTTPHRIPHIRHSRPGRKAGCILVASLVLGGCTSIPLDEPPRRPAPETVVVAPIPPVPPASSPSLPEPTPVEPAQTFPAPPSAAGATPAMPPAAAPPSAPASVPPDASVYGDAVAGRFPAPTVRYDTPALGEGRATFTTQAELQGRLRAMAVAGTADRAGAWLVRLGQSQTGVDVDALLFARAERPDPAPLVAAGRPTVLLIGQQHGDEPASAEALLAVAQELSTGRLARWLDRINVLVVPRANPDGALFFQRANTTGTDINRDHLLMRSPEARALARAAAEYAPAVVVDVHERPALGAFFRKFGVVQRHDVLVQYAMTPNVHPFVTRAADEWFRQPLLKALAARQLTVDWYHTTSDVLDDRTLAMGTTRPETARNVNGLRHAVSVLLEGRGSDLGHLHLQRRVHALVASVESLLASTAERAADLARLRRYVEADVSAQACRGDIAVGANLRRTEYQLVAIDPVTGADRRLTVDWDSALDLVPRKVRPRPCGYWLAAGASEAVAKLRAWGVSVQQVQLDARVPGDNFQRLPGEGGVPQVEVIDALIDMPAGSFYVPLTQPLANLIIAALEPDTPSSFAAHGVLPGVESVARIQTVPDLPSATAVP